MTSVSITKAAQYLPAEDSIAVCASRCPECGQLAESYFTVPGAVQIELTCPGRAGRKHTWTIPVQKREQREAVNHPQHYGGDVTHEVWKCLNAWGLEQDALLWNAVKYISRAGKKDDALEDLKKAEWYLSKRIERMEKMKS